MIDDASLPLRVPRREHLGDDGLDRVGIALDRAGQGIATERAEADLSHHRTLAVLQRQPLIVDHDERPVALDHGARSGEVQRHDRDALAPDVLPDVKLGPVRQRKYPDALALVRAGVVQRPELGTLLARVPAMLRGAEREDALLGTTLLL